jgi:hypothetical protein
VSSDAQPWSPKDDTVTVEALAADRAPKATIRVMAIIDRFIFRLFWFSAVSCTTAVNCLLIDPVFILSSSPRFMDSMVSTHDCHLVWPIGARNDYSDGGMTNAEEYPGKFAQENLKRHFQSDW